MQNSLRPRRSVLYMPGSNRRALAKGAQLAVDGLILDLEDSVSPECKIQARRNIAEALGSTDYGHRELAIRVNGLDSEWGAEDLRQMATLDAHAIVLPKVESARMIDDAMAYMQIDSRKTAIWCMIETPRGVMHAEAIADHPHVECLVMGTSDLSKELRSIHARKRLPMLTSLTWCLLAARAARIAILDGVHLDLQDDVGFKQSCEQGRELGFDGKTLIHPKQIDAANHSFAPDHDLLEWSRRIIDAFENARTEGKGVTVVDGKLIENLHIAEAKRLIQLAELIEQQDF